jgi:hypothetical protein
VTRDELGSEWHHIDLTRFPADPLPWGPAAWTGTGRDALRLALDAVRPEASGVLWVPTYTCPSFVCVASDWVLRGYRDLPDAPLDVPEVGPRDVLLLHNPFGLRARPERPPGIVFEDHSHAPFSSWARTSEADFAMASVRKVLPLPDGGALWSPAGRPLPAVPPIPEGRAAAVENKRQGMADKAAYLAGAPIDKDAFRALLASGESGLGSHGPAAMSPGSRALVGHVPIRVLREARRRNLAALTAGLDGVSGVRVLQGVDVPGFGVLLFRTADARDRVRTALVATGVYPSALWPMDAHCVPVTNAERDFAARSFALPIDIRAAPTQLENAATTIRAALG